MSRKDGGQKGDSVTQLKNKPWTRVEKMERGENSATLNTGRQIKAKSPREWCEWCVTTQ